MELKGGAEREVRIPKPDSQRPWDSWQFRANRRVISEGGVSIGILLQHAS